MRRRLAAVFVLPLVACAADPPASEPEALDDAVTVDGDVAPAATCTTCGDPKAPSDPSPRCSDACTSSSYCATSCIGSFNRKITCGEYGRCQSCASACTATASCATTCMEGTTRSSCLGYGTCQKYDAYCAYPVITSAAVSDNNESGAGGAQAYMYFASSGYYPKSGTFASAIGGYAYDPGIAWASNFRGPAQVGGESSRVQWEWDDSIRGGLSVTWGSAGAPYLYGRQCWRVPAGSSIPKMTTKTEKVYEDDECFFGFCNPDDYVGSFTIDRGVCNTEIFGRGIAHGWSSTRAASVTGDISQVGYKLWCYSCKSTPTGRCSDGVVN